MAFSVLTFSHCGLGLNSVFFDPPIFDAFMIRMTLIFDNSPFRDHPLLVPSVCSFSLVEAATAIYILFRGFQSALPHLFHFRARFPRVVSV